MLRVVSFPPPLLYETQMKLPKKQAGCLVFIILKDTRSLFYISILKRGIRFSCSNVENVSYMYLSVECYLYDNDTDNNPKELRQLYPIFFLRFELSSAFVLSVIL